MLRHLGSCTGIVFAAALGGVLACSTVAPAAADEAGPPDAPDESPMLTWNHNPPVFPLGVLIETLDDETRAGRIAWHETDRANSFVVPFDGYTVEIAATIRPGTDFPDYILSKDYIIRIFDRDGRAVVNASDVALDAQLGPRNASFFPVMGDMWAGAQRTVLGTDHAIAEIQEQLDARRCDDGSPPEDSPPEEATPSQPCS